jgi:hypothetical protein
MNRRGFLQRLGAVAAALGVVPRLPVSTEMLFTPKYYGVAVEIRDPAVFALVKADLEAAVASINSIVAVELSKAGNS